MSHIMLKALVLTVLLIAGFANASNTNNLVLVHGAHFTEDSWLQVKAHIKPTAKVVTVNLPGRDGVSNAKDITLTKYAESLCQSLSKLNGDIHIAAHSQGGAVANRALGLCSEVNVQSITYITSVAPLQGQTAFELLNKKDEENYMASMRFDESTHRMHIKDQVLFSDYFAQDANAQQKEVLISTALAEPAHIGDEVMMLKPELFAKIKKYYVFANQDKIITLESQIKIAGQLDLQAVYALDTGHSPMLTQAKPLAQILNRVIK
ncbi:MAG: alpha/beta hydrolase [Cellvibrionaceae bacterium]